MQCQGTLYVIQSNYTTVYLLCIIYRNQSELTFVVDLCSEITASHYPPIQLLGSFLPVSRVSEGHGGSSQEGLGPRVMVELDGVDWSQLGTCLS